MSREQKLPERELSLSGSDLLEKEIARCQREIEAVEEPLMAGHPDVEGLCQALSDWSAELRILKSKWP